MKKKSKYKPYTRTSECPSCPEHTVWHSMWQRCLNKNNNRYEAYGGRGITVCERWRDFFKFVEDMGRRPKGMTLERDDNNGNYEPENCRWATNQEQIENRRCTVRVTIRGRTRALTSWCRILGVKRDTVKSRYRVFGCWKKALIDAKRNLNHEAIVRVKINGVTKTVRQWCEEYGVKVRKTWQRVRRGMEWLEALETKDSIPNSDRNFWWKKELITINGRSQSLRAWSRELGVPMGTIWKRMKKRGMTAEQALFADKRINQHK